MSRRARSFVPTDGPADCTGCGICREHCPANGAIRLGPGSHDEHVSRRVRVLQPEPGEE